MEIKDELERTPLLLAAAKAAWRSCNLLLERGAIATVTDEDKRTVLHLLVLNGDIKKHYFESFDKQVMLYI